MAVHVSGGGKTHAYDEGEAFSVRDGHLYVTRANKYNETVTVGIHAPGSWSDVRLVKDWSQEG